MLTLGIPSTRRRCAYPAEGLEAEAVGVPCATDPIARLRKQKVGDGRREHLADREHREDVCRIRQRTNCSNTNLRVFVCMRAGVRVRVFVRACERVSECLC